MKKDIIKLTNDYVFKYVFGDSKHTNNLKNFLSALGELPGGEVRRLTVRDPFLKRWFRNDKYGILDLRVETASGTIVNVEVQVCEHNAMKERIIYYLSKMVWEQLRGGDNFAKIRPVVSVFICNFDLVTENQKSFYNRIRLWNEQVNKVFTDLLKIVIIELPKVPVQDDGSRLWNWMALMKSETLEEMEMLARKDPELREAVNDVRYLSFSERHRRLADARERYRRDTVAYGETQREKAYRDAARRMKALRLPVDTIVQVTGLSAQEIAKL
jgi:predicted transposase/invertase (TIGR01784 family)